MACQARIIDRVQPKITIYFELKFRTKKNDDISLKCDVYRVYCCVVPTVFVPTPPFSNGCRKKGGISTGAGKQRSLQNHSTTEMPPMKSKSIRRWTILDAKRTGQKGSKIKKRQENVPNSWLLTEINGVRLFETV